jgi:hypothetical protein
LLTLSSYAMNSFTRNGVFAITGPLLRPFPVDPPSGWLRAVGEATAPREASGPESQAAGGWSPESGAVERRRGLALSRMTILSFMRPVVASVFISPSRSGA